VLSSLQVLPTPAGGMALYTPVIRKIQPGADVTHCTYTDVVTDEDLFVHTTKGVESSMGHHVILYYTTSPEKPRTEECFGQGMEKLNQIIGGGGGEGAAFYDPPANVGAIIPKGSQFVIQTHWINTGADPVDVQAMMVTVPGEDGPDRIVTGTVTAVDLSFQVPAMGKLNSSAECVFEEDHQLLMAIGHEHEWGTHVRADLTRVDGTAETLFDRDFKPSDVFDPPINAYTVEKPLQFRKGDKLKMSCDWRNTTTDLLSFPREMCVFFGYSMEEGDARCINGVWIHPGASAGDAGAGQSGPPCAAVDAPGNEKGIGKYCTKGGKQCTGSASICIADYSSGAFGDFCTTLCNDDSTCGSGATCLGQGGPKVCIPTSCLGGSAADAGAAATDAGGH
jgi:hypothetical protein